MITAFVHARAGLTRTAQPHPGSAFRDRLEVELPVARAPDAEGVLVVPVVAGELAPS